MGIGILEWFGITDPTHNGLLTKSEIELVECQEALTALEDALDAFGQPEKTASIERAYREAIQTLLSQQASVASITPRDDEEASPQLVRAWEAWFAACDAFQSVTDNTTEELRSGVFAKKAISLQEELRLAAQDALAKAGDLIPGVPTWAKAIGILTLGTIAILGIAYIVGKVKG